MKTLDALLGPRGDFGEVLEGSENEVEKGNLQIHAGGAGRGGCPLKIVNKDKLNLKKEMEEEP